MNGTDLVQTIGQVVTAIGVLVAAWQLKQAEKQAITDFEDAFPREYRELSRRIPLKAVFGERLSETELGQAMPALFHYIDLCNEQVFLRQINRVSAATWLNWCRGIESNLKLPAFKRAWHEIKAKTTAYAELRRLEESDFQDDPLAWGPQQLPSASAEKATLDETQEAAKDRRTWLFNFERLSTAYSIEVYEMLAAEMPWTKVKERGLVLHGD